MELGPAAAGPCACRQPSPAFNPMNAPELSTPSPPAGPALPWGPVTASWAPCHNSLSSHPGLAPRCERWVLAEAVAGSFLSAQMAISGVWPPWVKPLTACPQGGHSPDAQTPHSQPGMVLPDSPAQPSDPPSSLCQRGTVVQLPSRVVGQDGDQWGHVCRDWPWGCLGLPICRWQQCSVTHGTAVLGEGLGALIP